MSLLKSSTEKAAAPVWFVVEREGYGAMASTRTDRDAAIADFGVYVARAAATGEPYTPFQRGRRLAVIGPNVHTRAADDFADTELYPMPDDEAEDPLLYGLVALRAVLDDDEYAYVVHAPVAAALLES